MAESALDDAEEGEFRADVLIIYFLEQNLIIFGFKKWIFTVFGEFGVLK